MDHSNILTVKSTFVPVTVFDGTGDNFSEKMERLIMHGGSVLTVKNAIGHVTEFDGT